jgi:hypothetical protein
MRKQKGKSRIRNPEIGQLVVEVIKNKQDLNLRL